MIEKLVNNNKKVVFIITVFTVFAQHKILSFFFWWDDFSMLYNAQNKVCLFDWPFTSNCVPYQFLYDIFGQNAFYYFLVALLLRILIGFLFYIFSNKFFSKRVSLLLSLIVVSIGGEDMMMTFYATWQGSTLSLLLGSMILILNAQKIKGVRKIILYFGVVLLYSISLFVFPIYSISHIFTITLLLLIFVFRDRKIESIILFGIISLVTLGAYLLVPYIKEGDALLLLERGNASGFGLKYILEKIEFYLDTTSSFMIGDYFDRFLIGLGNINKIRIITGGLMNIFFILFIIYLFFKKNKSEKILSIAIFSFFWMITRYIPKGMVTNYGLSSTDRHIFFPYIGFVLMLGVITTRWKKLTVVLYGALLLNIVLTNIHYQKLAKVNKDRKMFHLSVAEHVSEVPGGSVFFFDAKRGEANEELGTFVRAGMLDHESSIATTLGVKMEGIRIITEDTSYDKYFKDNKINPNSFFSFYFDGDFLYDTTINARQILKEGLELTENVGKEIRMSFIRNDNTTEWTGTSSEINFTIDDFSPILPTILRLNVKASVPEIPLPYTQECIDCIYDQVSFKESLEFATKAREVKKNFSVQEIKGDNDTEAYDLLDNNTNSYYLPFRSDWFGGIFTPIVFKTNTPQEIGGIIIHSGSVNRRPIDFVIVINGVNREIIDKEFFNEGFIKLGFKKVSAREVEIKILETDGGDSPLIEEVDFIPAGFIDTDLRMLGKVVSAPAAKIKSEKDLNVLKKYLQSGGLACIKWKSSYGEGKIDFIIRFDGLEHTYKIRLPSMGIENPRLTLGCINYPVDLVLNKISISSK